ncbi:MAG: endonuclease NucS [Archaeoglobaceae archaeon]
MPKTLTDVIREITNDWENEFTTDEVIRAIYDNYPEKPWKESSIRAHLVGLSVNHPSAHHYPTLYRQAFLYNVGPGRYKLFDPEVDEVPEELEPTEEVEETASISLERDVEDYLVRDLSRIEEGLKLFEERGLTGRQYKIDKGYIDILAVDKNQNLVVIEIKAGTAQNSVVGQILSYISWVRKNLAQEGEVRGIIIASDFDERCIWAAEEIKNLSLMRYRIEFQFEQVI